MALKILEVGTTDTIDASGLKDGSLISANWIQAQILQGKGYLAYYGSGTTPVTLDASWANTDPDISLDVPDGRIVIPLRVRVVMEAYGSTALFETLTLCSRTLAAASAGTAFVPINLRTRTGGGSACSVYTAPTVTSGYTTGAFELYRNCIEKIATISTGDDDSARMPNIFEWTIGTNGYAPVLEGNASMATWATAQTTTGYLQLEWLEFAEGEI